MAWNKTQIKYLPAQRNNDRSKSVKILGKCETKPLQQFLVGKKKQASKWNDFRKRMKLCGQIIYYVIIKLKRADGILAFETLNVWISKIDKQTKIKTIYKQTKF